MTKPENERVFVYVSPGEGAAQLVSTLRDHFDFMPLPAHIYLRLTGAARLLQVGEYEIAAGDTAATLFAKIVTGQRYQRFLTLPEGLSSPEIAALIIDGAPDLAGLGTAAKLTEVIGDRLLLPETYAYEWGDTATALIDRMAAAHLDLVLQEWQSLSENVRQNIAVASARDAVILASIIEKETGIASERDMVSAVFHNRLRLGMRLQSDPTVIFALTGGPPLTRALTRRDWRVNHPYNTYRIKGLPPGPIAHPGAAAIQAAMRPKAVPFLYFVADGRGGHVFAQTLKDHNANVARYRALRKNR